MSQRVCDPRSNLVSISRSGPQIGTLGDTVNEIEGQFQLQFYKLSRQAEDYFSGDADDRLGKTSLVMQTSLPLRVLNLKVKARERRARRENAKRPKKGNKGKRVQNKVFSIPVRTLKNLLQVQEWKCDKIVYERDHVCKGARLQSSRMVSATACKARFPSELDLRSSPRLSSLRLVWTVHLVSTSLLRSLHLSLSYTSCCGRRLS